MRIYTKKNYTNTTLKQQTIINVIYKNKNVINKNVGKQKLR